MKRFILFLALITLTLSPLNIVATCGGGGGGGKGGIPSGGGDDSGPAAKVYQVPWILLQAGDTNLPAQGLTLLWFPTTPEEVQASDLRSNRSLFAHASNCVTMIIVPPDHVEYTGSYATKDKPPTLILVDGSRQEISRIDVDINGETGASMVGSELDQREAALKALLKEGKALAKKDQDEAAITRYQDVYNQACLFPSLAKKARKALKKLGVVVDKVSLTPMKPEVGEYLLAALETGLKAEWQGDYEQARVEYTRAHDLDPFDPVPLRYLGELYRHHTGEWDLAMASFAEILALDHADPMSRAVALHGTGKMTIHGGEFDQGLDLFEQSIAAYPLALTYRNLAVYWNSEDNFDKAYGYVVKALALEPDDGYNQIFAATYLVGMGHKDEALAIAEKFADDLPSSYNLAAIHALAGQPEQALTMLKRHFYEFEQYDDVRKREMWEAREDIVFSSLHNLPEFKKLTALSR